MANKIRTTHYEKDDKISGSSIILKAGRLSRPTKIQISGNHRGYKIKGSLGATAFVEIPLRTVSEKKK